jgi:hypothetical protein
MDVTVCAEPAADVVIFDTVTIQLDRQVRYRDELGVAKWLDFVTVPGFGDETRFVGFVYSESDGEATSELGRSTF